MNIDQKIIDRFDALIETAHNSVLTGKPVSTFTISSSSGQNMGSVSQTTSDFEWGANCIDLIRRIFSDNSEQYRRFNSHLSAYLQAGVYNGTELHAAVGILRSAREVYADGYLFHVKALIEADVFTDILDQADELFNKGYDLPAAVVAGSVLEDALRKLCDRHQVVVPDPKDPTKPKEKPTMNDYNIALTKAGVYEKATNKMVDAAAAIRNHAAHGERDKFEAGQVRLMIDQIRYFMDRYFANS